jgi:hypothetical protein
MSTIKPTLEEVIRQAVKFGVAQVHTAIPAIVTKFDISLQQIEAQIVIRGRYADSDGNLQSYEPIIVPNIPVAYPSANGFSIVWPLEIGDPVTLIFCERSIDEWKATGEDDITAQDLRRHNLTDAIAIPGGRSFADPVDSKGYDSNYLVVRGDIKLGSSSASDYVALASLVKSEITALRNYVATMTMPVVGAVAGPPTILPPAVGDVAAGKVLAE